VGLFKPHKGVRPCGRKWKISKAKIGTSDADGWRKKSGLREESLEKIE